MSFEDFMDDGILSQRAEHAFQAIGAGGLDGELALGVDMTHNEGLCDGMDLFGGQNLVSASGGDLDDQVWNVLRESVRHDLADCRVGWCSYLLEMRLCWS